MQGIRVERPRRTAGRKFISVKGPKGAGRTQQIQVRYTGHVLECCEVELYGPSALKHAAHGEPAAGGAHTYIVTSGPISCYGPDRERLAHLP